MKRASLFVFALAGALFARSPLLAAPDGQTDNSPDWFYPRWAAEATYNTPLAVRDTDSALGRYSLKTKEIGLKDLARAHGHLCDGLVTSYVEIGAALRMLFPDGVVDRTDLRAVSRNSPCSVDAISLLTGARINFQTLRIDNSLPEGFIVQRISTGQAYAVRLKAGVVTEAQAALEMDIRRTRAQGRQVTASEIDRFEQLARNLSKRLLSTPPDDLLIITALPDYKFAANDLNGSRGDIIDKDAPRTR